MAVLKMKKPKYFDIDELGSRDISAEYLHQSAPKAEENLQMPTCSFVYLH